MLLRVTAAGVLLTVALVAQPQPQHSPPGWPCVAGRAVDPTYVALAERTGGQVFMFDRSEAGRSLVLMREDRKHEEGIFRATGTFPAGSQGYQIHSVPTLPTVPPVPLLH